MYDIIGDYYLENGIVRPVDSFQLETHSEQVIYEVIRVINGKILFLEDHMQRLRHSLDFIHLELSLVDKIQRDLNKLLEGHSFNQNIKIDVYDHTYRCYFIKSKYPDKSLYDSGVDVCILEHHRKNPEIKALDMAYKARIEEIKGNQYFEVLLKDEEGHILEGSRSNVIYVKGNQIISAPLNEILNGVTFKNVVKMAHELNIDVVYRKIHHEELKDLEACFLTGTSLGVLPIRKIYDLEYDVKHPVLKQLMESYGQLYKK
ncbi:MAG: aminotransferase class IV [Clostridia bacterium]|nr:aminotransferase class IV [Clostridia bacterium]